MILQRYADEHHFLNTKFFVDDGFSGVSFERENCDYSNLEEIANSFSSLLLSLVEQALEIGKLCGES